MSKFKYSPNLYIGAKELKRQREFLDDDGYRKLLLNEVISFGVLNNSKDGNWTDFLVEQGTNAGTIKHSLGFAIDNLGNFLVKPAIDNVVVIDDSNWYWVRIAHQFSNDEIGTVAVDSSGNITGTGTLFTEVLRGGKTSIRVKFSNATLNTGEYEVLSVTNDTTAILKGVLQAETLLKMVVVGTFTPDANPSAGDKDIYDYDDTLVSLELETVLNVPPSFTQDLQFHIARVKRTGATMVIEDKRSRDIFRTKEDFHQQNVTATSNPLIGVEAVKFDDDFSVREKNLVEVAWAFRSDNWTMDVNTNTVTFNGGQGGKYKATTDFTDNDFNGWRLYTENGKYGIIKASSKSGSQINLVLDGLDPDDFSNGSQELLATPDVDFVKIIVLDDQTTPSTANLLIEERMTFPVNTPLATVKVNVFKDPSASFIFKYQYKKNGRYNQEQIFPSDVTSGYLTEVNFDANGQVSGSVRQTYTASATTAFIILQLNANAFKKLVDRVDLGDLPAVTYRSLDNGNPVLSLTVGTQDKYQVWQNSLTLSIDHYISLETTGAVEGNRFFLKFENDATLSGQIFEIVEDYINTGSTGTTLLDFALPTDFWRDRAAGNNMWVECVFDGTNWLIYPDASVTQAVLDLISGGSVLITGSVSTGVQKYDSDPTAKPGWDALSIPDRAFVTDQDALIVDGAPSNLNTLNEIAAAIADDPNFSATIDAQKIDKDGTLAFAADQPMGGFKLTGLAAGSAAGHSVRFEQIGAGTDTTAIHDNVASEISAITPKTTPVAGDFFLIEDSAGANVKKSLTFGNLESTLIHDNLAGFVGNEHIDHSTLDIITAANSGLSGGAALTSDVTLTVDFNNLVTDTSIAAGDLIPFRDISPAANNNITFANFESALSIEESQIPNGTILARVGSTETITSIWTFSAAPDVGTVGITEDGKTIKRKVVDIGVWDMVTNGTVTVAVSGLDWTKVRRVTAMIQNDDNVATQRLHPLERDDSFIANIVDGGAGETDIVLNRNSAGFFDNVDFDSTTAPANRGYVVIDYIT